MPQQAADPEQTLAWGHFFYSRRFILACAFTGLFTIGLIFGGWYALLAGWVELAGFFPLVFGGVTGISSALTLFLFNRHQDQDGLLHRYNRNSYRFGWGFFILRTAVLVLVGLLAIFGVQLPISLSLQHMVDGLLQIGTWGGLCIHYTLNFFLEPEKNDILLDVPEADKPELIKRSTASVLRVKGSLYGLLALGIVASGVLLLLGGFILPTILINLVPMFLGAGVGWSVAKAWSCFSEAIYYDETVTHEIHTAEDQLKSAGKWSGILSWIAFILGVVGTVVASLVLPPVWGLWIVPIFKVAMSVVSWAGFLSSIVFKEEANICQGRRELNELTAREQELGTHQLSEWGHSSNPSRNSSTPPIRSRQHQPHSVSGEWPRTLEVISEQPKAAHQMPQHCRKLFEQKSEQKSEQKIEESSEEEKDNTIKTGAGSDSEKSDSSRVICSPF